MAPHLWGLLPFLGWIEKLLSRGAPAAQSGAPRQRCGGGSVGESSPKTEALAQRGLLTHLGWIKMLLYRGVLSEITRDRRARNRSHPTPIRRSTTDDAEPQGRAPFMNICRFR